ncbi:MAG: S-formylglutathione hydrolase [Bdellovibrionota bacterium]
MEKTKSYKQFGGYTNYYSHESKITGTKMNFAAYLPPQAGPAPVLYWLSGLTCTEENFITKAYAQLFAARTGFVVVAPDTSPRGANIPGEDDSYDLGTGAGFYVDATQAPWAKNYKMYSYITEELRELVEKNLPVDPSRSAISGHSMGGHGALTLGLRNPGLYKSISAFAPICNPMHAPWGKKAFGAYLGANEQDWAKYDATELVKKANTKTPILIDQGLDDEFLKDQLHTDTFEQACKAAGHSVMIRRREGYDHSYFFISTFLEEHFAFHAEQLNRQ